MWNKLTIFAAVLLLAAGAFAYNNYTGLEAEQAEKTSRTDTLDNLLASVKQQEDKLALARQTAKDLEAECNSLTDQHTEMVAKNQELETQITEKEQALETITTQLADIESKSKDMNNVAQLVAEIERTEQDNTRLAGEVSAAEAKRDALVARSEQIDKSVADLNKLEDEQRARISPASLRTSIRNVFNDWGFVVLSGGADQGIVLGSRLAVMRGDTKVAELLVNNVESAKASADIVPASKAEGVTLSPGDVVVAVRPQS